MLWEGRPVLPLPAVPMDRQKFKSVGGLLTFLLRHKLQTRDGWVAEEKIIGHHSCIKKGYDEKMMDS